MKQATHLFFAIAGAAFHNLPFWGSTAVYQTERLGRPLICLGNLSGLEEVYLFLFHHLSPLKQGNLRGIQLLYLYYGAPTVARAPARCSLLVLSHQRHIRSSSAVTAEADLRVISTPTPFSKQLSL